MYKGGVESSVWMQTRVLAIARYLADAPPGALVRTDQEFDRIVGDLWTAACRGDAVAFKAASCEYGRHVLQVFDSRTEGKMNSSAR